MPIFVFILGQLRAFTYNVLYHLFLFSVNTEFTVFLTFLYFCFNIIGSDSFILGCKDKRILFVFLFGLLKFPSIISDRFVKIELTLIPVSISLKNKNKRVIQLWLVNFNIKIAIANKEISISFLLCYVWLTVVWNVKKKKKKQDKIQFNKWYWNPGNTR